MQDVAVSLDHRPGELARMGEALGRAGVSIEGGGAFLAGGKGIAHFLFHDGAAARAAPRSSATEYPFLLYGMSWCRNFVRMRLANWENSVARWLWPA